MFTAENLEMKLIEIINRHRDQYLILLAISFSLLALTSILTKRDAQVFSKLLGNIHPVLAILIIVILGFAAFSLIMNTTNLVIFKHGRRGLLIFSVIAAFFLAAAIILFVDIRGGYSKDINVLFPDGLFYYPVMGYIADILFHIVPFSILILLARFIFGVDLTHSIPIWMLVIISLLEPLFQALIIRSASWVQIYQFIHIFIINMIQLLLFRKQDFSAMYIFRMFYYLFWHIVWGFFRLDILF